MILRQSPLARLALSTRQINKARADVTKTEMEAITGLRVRRPSDDPAAWSELHGLSAARADQRRYQDNAARSTTLLNTADKALQTGGDLLKRGRELAIIASSETSNTSQRAAAAAEVRSLRDTLKDVANANIAGRYVFAGRNYDAPAYDAAFQYQGDAAVPEARVGADRRVQTGLVGSAFFDAAFQALDDVATRMDNDDAAGIAATLGDLDVGLQGLINARETVGWSMNATDSASEVAANLELFADSALIDRAGIDPAETYSRLVELRTTYEAALQVTARGLGRSLFDALR